MAPSVAVRILARYALGIFLGYLVTKQLLPSEIAAEMRADSEIIDLIVASGATLVTACVELWTVIARRLGKPT